MSQSENKPANSPFRLIKKTIQYFAEHGFFATLKKIYLFLRFQMSKLCSLPTLFRIQASVFLKDYKNAVLVFDHALGGGANSFSRELFTKILSENRKIVRVTNYVSFGEHLWYILHLIKNGKERELITYSLDDLLKALDSLSPHEIIYNSLVYMKGQERLLQWIGEKSTEFPVKIMIHDFYSLCPSYNLAASDGKYCRLDSSKCKDCYNSLKKEHMNGEEISLERWRELWGTIMAHAAEVRTFCTSSGELVTAVYPEAGSKLTLKPHSMEYFKAPPVTGLNTESLVLGVVGAICLEAKGIKPVEELGKWMNFRNIPLHIIGQFSGEKTPNMKITGKYTAAELSRLFRETGVNVVFFPSICPETFSYLISELILLDVPLLAFDFGAQAEKVGGYKRGAILHSDNPEDIYHEAEKLFNRVYRSTK